MKYQCFPAFDEDPVFPKINTDFKDILLRRLHSIPCQGHRIDLLAPSIRG